MEKYTFKRHLGDGTYGCVMECVNNETKERVAVKQMKQKYANWEECVSLREVKSLRRLNHPNIVRLREVLKVKDELFLVFEQMDVNLYEYYLTFKEKRTGKPFSGGMPETAIKQIIFQTACGLAYMHKHGYFHRDLKPENILISADRRTVKICDFGLARETRSRPPFTDYVSTRWYRAPELLFKSTVYNSPVDVFALACIMIELYMLNPLWAGASEIDHLNKIISTLGTPAPSLWPDVPRLASRIGFLIPQNVQKIPISQLLPQASPLAVDLLEKMLQYDPTRRPTAMQVLAHPYFTGQTEIPQDQQQQSGSDEQSQSMDLQGQNQMIVRSHSKNIDLSPRVSEVQALIGFRGELQEKRDKQVNASQFVAKETERINREKQTRVKDTYGSNLIDFENRLEGGVVDPIWDYQVNKNYPQQQQFGGGYQHPRAAAGEWQQLQNRGTEYKPNGGLDANSVKNPGKFPNAVWPMDAEALSAGQNYSNFSKQRKQQQQQQLQLSQKSPFVGSSTWNLSELKQKNHDFYSKQPIAQPQGFSHNYSYPAPDNQQKEPLAFLLGRNGHKHSQYAPPERQILNQQSNNSENKFLLATNLENQRNRQNEEQPHSYNTGQFNFDRLKGYY